MTDPKSYPDCPEGKVPFSRKNRKNPRKRDYGCRKGEWLSARQCANRSDNNITVTGDPVLEAKIINSIDKSADLCYKAKLDANGNPIKKFAKEKDPMTGKPVYDLVPELDSKGRPVKEPSGLFFCRENTGRPRSIMPQFENEFEDDVNRRGSIFRRFIDMLIERGIKISEDYVEVCKLKATQKVLEGDKVRKKLKTIEIVEGKLDELKAKEYKKIRDKISTMTMADIGKEYDEYLKKGVFSLSDTKDVVVDKLVKEVSLQYFKFATEVGRPIVVSKEGYILDGHHRWAALLAWDFKDGKDVPVKVHVKIVHLGITELLREAKKFIQVQKKK